MQHCGNCKYWKVWTHANCCSNNHDYDLGGCTAMNHLPIPYAWQSMVEEVGEIGTNRVSGEDCPVWADKALDSTVKTD